LFIYNWDKIYKYAKKDCEKVIRLIFCMTEYAKPNKQEYILIEKINQHKKESFIINEIDFMFDNTVTNTDKCVFLLLASKRNYSSYKLNNIDYIETYIVENIFDIEKLKRNKLLNIIDDKIYFKY